MTETVPNQQEDERCGRPTGKYENTLKNSERKVDQFKQQRQTVSDKTRYTSLQMKYE